MWGAPPFSERQALERFGQEQPALPAGLFGATAPGGRERFGIGRLASVGEAGSDLGLQPGSDVYVMIRRGRAKEPDLGDGVWGEAFVMELHGVVQRVTGVGVGGVERDTTSDAMVAMGGVGRPGVNRVVSEEQIRAMTTNLANEQTAQVWIVFQAAVRQT